MANLNSMERIWFDQRKFEDAERKLVEHVASQHESLVVEGVGLQRDAVSAQKPTRGVDSIKKMSNFIEESLKTASLPRPGAKGSPELERRVKALEEENKVLKAIIRQIEERLSALEVSSGEINMADSQDGPSSSGKKVEDDDDDFDLFGSDDEDDDTSASKQKPVQPPKAAKKKPVAKSSLVLEVKPWDDETDMKELETKVRSVATDGLLWGASKLVPVGYGIQKLQISCIVEDDKVSTDFLEEEICKFEDLIQSMDIAAFNKL
ncbi:elongation factor 1-delta-like [Dysidea avara]|uniref:elongation factor 1-delta-like n=1 Tax=Dysidea avara TaxID=196820 RepID=UPI003322E03A